MASSNGVLQRMQKRIALHDEIAALQQACDCEHIVKLFDVFDEPDFTYIVLECMTGKEKRRRDFRCCHLVVAGLTPSFFFLATKLLKYRWWLDWSYYREATLYRIRREGSKPETTSGGRILSQEENSKSKSQTWESSVGKFTLVCHEKDRLCSQEVNAYISFRSSTEGWKWHRS